MAHAQLPVVDPPHAITMRRDAWWLQPVVVAIVLTSFIVYATWSDPGGATADLNAVVDTTCYPMTRELGTDTLNATYMASVPLAIGCHSVFIVGDSMSMVRTVYPTTTAFGGAT